MKKSSFATNFRIAEPFNLDYVIRFYKLKKELSSSIFTIKALVAETFGLGGQLNYCLAIFHECATVSLLNNVTKST